MVCFRSVLENTKQNTFCFGFLMRKIGENRWQKHFGNIWSSSMYHRVSVEHFEIWHVRATVSFVSYWSLFMCIHDNGNIIPIFSGELGRFCCKCVSVWACVLVGFGDCKRLWFYRLYFVSLYFFLVILDAIFIIDPMANTIFIDNFWSMFGWKFECVKTRKRSTKTNRVPS